MATPPRSAAAPGPHEPVAAPGGPSDNRIDAGPSTPSALRGAAQTSAASVDISYAELHCLSNFSFLQGASHPHELVEQAAAFGYEALALTDRNSLAGVVRAHRAARAHGLHLIIGAEITPVDAPRVILLAPHRRAYAHLARLITRGRLRTPKGQCAIYFADLVDLAPHAGWIAIMLPDDEANWERKTGNTARNAPAHPLRQKLGAGIPPTPALSAGVDFPHRYRHLFGDDVYLAAELRADEPDDVRLDALVELARATGLPLVACNDVHYHTPERRYLQDVLTCIRHTCTIHEAGTRLFANAERHLRPLDDLPRRYARHPELLARSVAIARRCTFSLDELHYEYPHELVPPDRSAMDYLEELTWAGARERENMKPGTGNNRHDGVCGAQPLPREEGPGADDVPAFPRSYVPTPAPALRPLLARELALIRELRYEHYFLTVWDIVRFARSRDILCQGRGSAANSAVCYCLGVTAVDPARHDLLFERFVSRERNEPPDIDVDFEHERREEVFQYIYDKYGRDRAAIVAEVISYRARSATRDVAKALGLSLDRVDQLAKAADWSSAEPLPEPAVRSAGLDPRDRTVRMIVKLVRQLIGFPRHLSQHVGGFVITETPLCEIVPLDTGGLPDRTFIEWDKDDIDTLGILKIDCLALGMLTALKKALRLMEQYYGSGKESTEPSLTSIPPEAPRVYDMICAADTVGVFQIESRAQMSMLPRLKPRCFYDLVIEVAIVRPGPIQGGMVHPYLRRRNGDDPVAYPSEAVRKVLEKTLGVPLFQEQVMRLAVVAAGFTPGEADQLRRSMAAWQRNGELEKFQLRLVQGMLANGYSRTFAEQIYKQIRGFGEYGFPESHAASFALLVYASAWLKCYHPAAFTAALLNSQPMGFYAPAQLVQDALRHGVEVRGVDVNHSQYDCSLEDIGRKRREDTPPPPALRLGMRLVRGLSEAKVRGVVTARQEGPIHSIAQLARRHDVSREALLRLAAADTFRSLGLDRRTALWHILSLDDAQLPLFDDLPRHESDPHLPPTPIEETVAHDYDSVGLSLVAHPIGLVRVALARLNVMQNKTMHNARQGQRVAVSGLVTHRQRPSTARGTVFMTLEDETGPANLIIRPKVWERCRSIGRSRIALIADGRVERQDRVVHVQVTRLRDLSAVIGPLRSKSRDFK